LPEEPHRSRETIVRDLGTLSVCRVLSILGIVLIVGFHWIMGESTAEAITLLERIGLASLFGLFVSGTYVSTWMREQAHTFFGGLLFVVGLWIVRNAVVLGFGIDQMLALLIGIFTMGLVFRSTHALVAFHATMLVAVALGMRLAPPQGVHPLLVTGTQASMLFVSWFAARTRDRALTGLHRLSLVASHVHNGVLLLDDLGRVQWVNAGFSKMSGIAAEHVVGRSVSSVFADTRCAEAVATLQTAIGDGQALSQVELLHPRRGGSAVHVSLDLTPVRSSAGRIERFIAVETDISETHARARQLFEERMVTEQVLQQTERQLQHAQKLEAVGRLAGGIAHDFNNQLTVILGSTELALLELPPDAPGRSRLEEVRQSTLRAAELTRQILAFSRKQLLEPRVLDLNEVVHDVSKMLRRLIGEDIEMKLSLADDLEPVEADPGQLGQVIMNLAVNARDAMPGGGTLTIETANAVLDEEFTRGQASLRPGLHVMLAVRDTGVGMDEVVRSNIFEPFFTTKEAGQGTGLGLATVYGIVTQSGGDIRVNSEPDEGTTFEIYLPRTERSSGGSTDRAPTATESLSGATILVVEDEEAVRVLVSQILQGAGYRVLEANGPQEALDLVERCDDVLDLVLTDVLMPGMPGTELAERITNRFPDTRVLFMSGYTGRSLARRGLLDTRIHFLRKPFTTDELLDKVGKVLRSVQ